MPINNITQTISTLPEAGRRGVDVQTVFVTKQEDFQDHLQGTTVTELNTLKDQLNTRIGEINSTATTMNGYATSASSSASTATTKAGEASTSASQALTYKNQASTSATEAATSAASLTPSGILTKLKTVDGSGSGLDADLLDGLESTAFIRSTAIEYLDANNVASYPHFIRFTGDTLNTPISGRYFEGYSSSGWHVQRVSEVSGIVGYMPRVFERANRNGSWTPWVEILTTAYSLTTSPLGYASGTGGVVVQDTNKNIPVVLNKLCGDITMNNSALAPGQVVYFKFNNSFIGIGDMVDVSFVTSGMDNTKYYCFNTPEINGGFTYIVIKNTSTETLADSLRLRFSIRKGAIS